jgi:hypothetical protein
MTEIPTLRGQSLDIVILYRGREGEIVRMRSVEKDLLAAVKRLAKDLSL